MLSKNEAQNFTENSEVLLKKLSDEGDSGNLVQTVGIIADILNDVNSTSTTTNQTYGNVTNKEDYDKPKSVEVCTIVLVTSRAQTSGTINGLIKIK